MPKQRAELAETFHFTSVQLCHRGIRMVSVFRGVSGEPVVGLVSAVVAVVVGPAWRRGRIGLVVVLAECCGVVGGRVDVRLLEWRLVEVGSLIWQQVVLV